MVTEIEMQGQQAKAVKAKSGWRESFDVVASSSDIVHSYRDLLGTNQRGLKRGKALAKKQFSPGQFIVHFGVEGSWPGIPHHMVLFGPRFEGLMEDIFDRGVLPQDFTIYLHHPTVTDPGMAPEGKSTFYAAIQVANMGKLAIDWEKIGPKLEKRILDEVGRRLIPDIHDRIVTSFHYTPRDAALGLNAHLGSGFGLEPSLRKNVSMGGNCRDSAIKNFYLVGADTQSVSGIPGIVASAKATAGLMIEELKS